MRRRFRNKKRGDSASKQIEVIYEDRDVVIIDKPAGLISYPNKNEPGGSAIQQIRRYWKGRKLPNKHLYLVHRLDKETSGLMVFAKNTLARRSLADQFASHSALRVYVALTEGIPERRSGKIKTKLGRDIRGRRAVAKEGRLAITWYEVMKTFPAANRAMVRCVLQTGRTHQVRIHLAYLKTPVVGDMVYGKRSNRMMLHAEALGYLNPHSGMPVVFRTLSVFNSAAHSEARAKKQRYQ